TSCALAAVLVLFSTIRCAAQDQGSATVTLGPVKIQPSLVVHDIGQDHNVFNEPVNPKSDFTMTISPKADVTFQARKLKATLAQTVDFVYFKKYSSERGANESTMVQVDVDLGVFQPFASLRNTNTKSRPNNEIDERARHDTQDYAVGLGVKLFT